MFDLLHQYLENQAACGKKTSFVASEKSHKIFRRGWTEQARPLVYRLVVCLDQPELSGIGYTYSTRVLYLCLFNQSSIPMPIQPELSGIGHTYANSTRAFWYRPYLCQFIQSSLVYAILMPIQPELSGIGHTYANSARALWYRLYLC